MCSDLGFNYLGYDKRLGMIEAAAFLRQLLNWLLILSGVSHSRFILTFDGNEMFLFSCFLFQLFREGQGQSAIFKFGMDILFL